MGIFFESLKKNPKYALNLIQSILAMLFYFQFVRIQFLNHFDKTNMKSFQIQSFYSQLT